MKNGELIIDDKNKNDMNMPTDNNSFLENLFLDNNMFGFPNDLMNNKF